MTAPTRRMPTAGASLQLEGLTKTYRNETSAAVQDVNLSVAPGEFVTLLGPSGSGKTTTLNMIAGFIPVTAGRVLVDGRDVTTQPPQRRDLGFVFQNYALFPHMTVADNIAYPLKRRKMGRAATTARVASMAELVELGHLAHRRPSELSGGQQQRVALARALAAEPRALLLDEPLAALDRQLREALQDELRRLHRELGATILLVTHDQQEAFHLSDRVAVFSQGRLEQTAAPEDLYGKPETLFVARFFGESSALTGRIRGQRTLEIDGRSIPIPSTDLVDGTAAVLIIRPESVRVAGGDSSVDAAYTAGSAVIEDVIYRGSTRRVSMIVDADQRLVASIPAFENTAFRPGQQVTIGWNPAETAIVPASTSATNGETA